MTKPSATGRSDNPSTSSRSRAKGSLLGDPSNWWLYITLLGVALTILMFAGLIAVAIIQNDSLEQLTNEVHNQTTTIERVVKETNTRGRLTAERIKAICEATIPKDKREELCGS